MRLIMKLVLLWNILCGWKLEILYKDFCANESWKFFIKMWQSLTMVLEVCKDNRPYEKIVEIIHLNESNFSDWTEWTETTDLSEPRRDRHWVQNCERQPAIESMRRRCDKEMK